jgi:8-oxo-dGTP diphosphatase
MLRVPGALLGALATYTKIAWWGLVAPRVSEKRPLVVMQAVILSHDGILLSLRSDLQGWELPGGTLEEGEGFEEGLLREVREETGLEVEVERHVGDYVRTGFRPHTARVYLCHPIGGELQLSWESLELRHFDPARLPETLFPWYLAPIEDALGVDAGPVVSTESQGLREIWAGIRIDLRMRLGGSSDRSGGI